MYEFVETEDRKSIIEDLKEAETRLVSARTKMSEMGFKERAHKTGNFAQYIAGMQSLISYDFHDEDEKQQPGA